MTEPESMKGVPRAERTARDFAQGADAETLRYFRNQLHDILNKSRTSTHSDQIDAISGALAKAQTDFKTPKKTKVGKVMGKTKDGRAYEYSYKYADLQDVYDSARKALSDNELAVTHLCQEFVGQMELVTMLTHSSGQWFKSIYPVRPVKDTPQALGSAMTYARRYSVSALLGIASEEDDDGAEAERSYDKEKPTPAKPRQTQKPPQAPETPAERMKVMLADGSLQEFPRTQGGAKAALLCIEQACEERPDSWGPNSEVAWQIADSLPQLLIRDDTTARLLVEHLEGTHSVPKTL